MTLDLSKIGAAVAAAVAQGAPTRSDSAPALAFSAEQQETWRAVVGALPAEVKVPVDVIESNVGVKLLPDFPETRSPGNRSGDLAAAIRGLVCESVGGDGTAVWLSGYAEEAPESTKENKVYTGRIFVAKRNAIPRGARPVANGTHNPDGTRVTPSAAPAPAAS